MFSLSLSMRDTTIRSLPSKGAMLQMLAQTAVVLLCRCINLVVKCKHPLPMSVRLALLSLLSETCKCVLVRTNQLCYSQSKSWLEMVRYCVCGWGRHVFSGEWRCFEDQCFRYMHLWKLSILSLLNFYDFKAVNTRK